MPITPTLAMLPDSPDSRLLAELSSYADDLSEAGETIDLALKVGSESPTWQPLTSSAVVAYMRAFAHSNVRSGLLAHLSIPADLQAAHEMIRSYRNTTVAHSQSQLSMSLPLAVLTEDGRVRKVVPITVRHNLPTTTASRIADTIDRVSSLLQEQIRPLATRLAREYSSASPETIAAWPVPELNHQRAEEFSGKSRRGRTPRFTAYWDVEMTALESSIDPSV